MTEVAVRIATPADAALVGDMLIDVDTRRFYERHGFTDIEPGTNYRMLCYLREL